MKWNKSLFVSFGLLIVACSLYRVWDGRPFGFAPQIAMAVFAGSVIKNKKFSFLLPLVSMFLSDALYQLLYSNGLSKIPGFYSGQLTNYILFCSLTVFGFFVRSTKWVSILGASVAAPTAYFLLSNFQVWIGGGGYGRTSLLSCYVDGLPFYGYSVLATILFAGVFFGCYNVMIKPTVRPVFDFE
ncbi:MAG: hypothetical protein JWP88_2261 [Flaviaesturariibacter sp.]|nr:hypothetical protein [Flaviaesturariibacter sp.]